MKAYGRFVEVQRVVLLFESGEAGYYRQVAVCLARFTQQTGDFFILVPNVGGRGERNPSPCKSELFHFFVHSCPCACAHNTVDTDFTSHACRCCTVI